MMSIMPDQKNGLIVGLTSEETTAMRLQLRALGFAKVGSFQTFDDLNRSALVFGSVTHLFANIDSFEHSGRAIEYLADIRRWRQDIVVIMLSQHVHDDDFGSDRKRICDVTVRLPVSPRRLKNALAAAEGNNHQLTEIPRSPKARMVRNSIL